MNDRDYQPLVTSILVAIIAIVLMSCLSGCSTTVPVKQKFPEAVEGSMESCPELKTVDPNTDKLTEVMKTVAENYKEYHLCRNKVNDWIDWFKKQKSNFEK